MQDGDNWLHFAPSTFSGTDSSYSLPNNVALLTLQVCKEDWGHLERVQDSLSHFTLSLSLMSIYCFSELLQEFKNGKVLVRLAHLYEVVISFTSVLIINERFKLPLTK